MWLVSRFFNISTIFLQLVSQLEYQTKCRKVNVTTLCANKRKRLDKKSRRKRPRIDDVDVISAADAEPHQDVIDEDNFSGDPAFVYARILGVLPQLFPQ